MTNNTPNNTGTDPRLLAAREEIVATTSRVYWKKVAIMGATTVAGAALGAFVGPSVLPATTAATLLPMGALYGGLLGFVGGGTLADAVTLTDRTRLELNREQLLPTQAQGTNWWGAYREQVMDHAQPGQLTPPPMMASAPPQSRTPRGR